MSIVDELSRKAPKSICELWEQCVREKTKLFVCRGSCWIKVAEAYLKRAAFTVEFPATTGYVEKLSDNA